MQREDLNPIEEAEGITRLQEEYQYTQEELAKILGKSRPQISNTIRLLKLPHKVQEFVQNKFLFTISSLVILTSGTIFCMWLGEKITDKGIGNGISMLIMIGIISRFPGSIVAEALSRGMNQALIFLIEIGVLFLVMQVETINSIKT